MQKVHFLTPAYDGTCHINTAWSLMLEIMILKDLGIESTWDFHPGCCYIELARNMLIDTFLKGNATDAFFIDGDVQWEPGATVKMLRHDKDFVCGAYPYKSDTEGYPIAYEQDENGRPVVDPKDGLIDAKLVPTGFMRLRRTVFERMIEKFGDDLTVEDHKDPENVLVYNAFFQTTKIDNQFFGEDVYFGNVWREMGEKIWVEPDITFWHHGMKSFNGNFHDYLRALPGGGGPPPKEWEFEPRT